METALNKATDTSDTFPKDKHVRELIVYSCGSKQRTRELYKKLVERMEKGNSVTHMKIIQVIHRIMFDGLPEACTDELFNPSFLNQLQREKQSFKQDGSTLIFLNYIKVLDSKMKLHTKYHFIPGSLDEDEFKSKLKKVNLSDCAFVCEVAESLYQHLDVCKENVNNIIGILGRVKIISLQALIVTLMREMIGIYYVFYDLIFNTFVALHNDKRYNKIIELFNDLHRTCKQIFDQVCTMREVTALVTIPQLDVDPPDFSVIVMKDMPPEEPPKEPTPPPQEPPKKEYPKPESLFDDFDFTKYQQPAPQTIQPQTFDFTQKQEEVKPVEKEKEIVYITKTVEDTDKINRLLKRIKELEDEINDLKIKMDALKASNKKQQNSLTENEELKKRIEELMKEIEELKKQAEKAKELEEENTQLKCEIEELKHRIEELEVKEKELEEKTKECEELMENNEKLNTELAELRNELEGMKGEKEELEKKCKDLEEEKKKIEEEKQRIDEEKKAKEEEMETKSKEWEEMKAKNEEDIAQLNKEKEELEKDNKQKQDEIEELRKKLEEREAKIAELMKMIETLEGGGKDKDKNIEELVNAKDKLNAENEDNKKKIEELEKKLKECEEIKQAKEKELTEKEEQWKECEEKNKDKITELEKRIKELEEELEKKNKENAELKEIQEKQMKEIESKDIEMKGLNEQLAQMKQNIESKEVENKEIKEDNTKKDEQIKELLAQLAEMKKKDEEKEIEMKKIAEALAAKGAELEAEQIARKNDYWKVVEILAGDCEKELLDAMTNFNDQTIPGNKAATKETLQNDMVVLKSCALAYTEALKQDQPQEAEKAIAPLKEALKALLADYKGVEAKMKNNELKLNIRGETAEVVESVKQLILKYSDRENAVPAEKTYEIHHVKEVELINAIEEGGIEVDVSGIDDDAERELLKAADFINGLTKDLDKWLSKQQKGVSAEMDVNQAIMESAQAIAKATAALVSAAAEAQKERARLGKANATPTKPYAPNQVWSEGLVTAGKMVAEATRAIVTVANNNVTPGAEKDEDAMIASSREIGKATAQLVCAARSKADFDSPTLGKVESASSGVIEATKLLVAAVKAISDFNKQKEKTIDFSKMSDYQLIIKEREASIAVLRLRRQLNDAETNLKNLNKQRYERQNSD